MAVWPKEPEKPPVRGKGEWEAVAVKGKRKFERGPVLTFCIKKYIYIYCLITYILIICILNSG